MSLSNFFEKRDFLWDKDTLEWKTRNSGPVLACNLDFAKEKGLEPKVKISKIVKIRKRGVHISLTQTFYRRDLKAVAGRFFAIVSGKNSYFNAIWITFRMFLASCEITKFLRFESQLKKSN